MFSFYIETRLVAEKEQNKKIGNNTEGANTFFTTRSTNSALSRSDTFILYSKYSGFPKFIKNLTFPALKRSISALKRITSALKRMYYKSDIYTINMFFKQLNSWIINI